MCFFFFSSFGIFFTQVKVKLGQKFFFSRKIFNVNYFLLKEISRGTDLVHMSRIRNVFSAFQNLANDF